jgi:hypothetical protein
VAYLRNLGIALTQVLNAALGGYPDETTSARAHRLQHRLGWRLARGAINGLFFLERDHCAAAHRAEMDRRQLPPALR